MTDERMQPHTDATAIGVAVRLRRAANWPGLLGLLGIVFFVVGVWFVASSIALGSKAAALAAAPVDNAAAIAESSRWWGFGDRFVETVLKRTIVEKKVARVVPSPLQGMDLKRVVLAVEANARSSWVFGLLALFLSALLWGLRLFDPAIRAEHQA
jgi:hypothetical protein